MKNIKTVLSHLPEYYLIVLVLLSGYTPPISINPFAIVLAFLLVLQVIFKGKATGLAIAGLFIMVNLYMLGALISEFNEFPTFNAGAAALVFGGSGIFILNLLAATAMIFKYAGNGNRSALQGRPSH